MRYRALSSRGAVKRSALFVGIIAALSLEAIGSARATTIDLDLGTPPHVTSKVTNSFDALPGTALQGQTLSLDFTFSHGEFVRLDRKSTRLNSSHRCISYAVFCLKKKNIQ